MSDGVCSGDFWRSMSSCVVDIVSFPPGVGGYTCEIGGPGRSFSGRGWAVRITNGDGKLSLEQICEQRRYLSRGPVYFLEEVGAIGGGFRAIFRMDSRSQFQVLSRVSQSRFIRLAWLGIFSGQARACLGQNRAGDYVA
jgi:hypothetical protein